MASSGLTIGCLLLLVALVLHVTGLATTYWYTLSYGTSNTLHAGLFQICVASMCYTYFSYGFSWSINYIGFVGLQCLGGLLQLIALIVGLASCSNENQRAPIQNISGLCFGAGACIIGGIIWFAVSVYINVDTYYSLLTTVLDIKLGWSFYLSCAGGSLTFILAITLCIIAGNMSAQSGGVVQPQPQPQPMVIMTGQQGGMLPPSQPYGQPYGQQSQPYPGQTKDW